MSKFKTSSFDNLVRGHLKNMSHFFGPNLIPSPSVRVTVNSSHGELVTCVEFTFSF